MGSCNSKLEKCIVLAFGCGLFFQQQFFERVLPILFSWTNAEFSSVGLVLWFAKEFLQLQYEYKKLSHSNYLQQLFYYWIFNCEFQFFLLKHGYEMWHKYLRRISKTRMTLVTSCPVLCSSIKKSRTNKNQMKQSRLPLYQCNYSCFRYFTWARICMYVLACFSFCSIVQFRLDCIIMVPCCSPNLEYLFHTVYMRFRVLGWCCCIELHFFSFLACLCSWIYLL